MNLEPSARTSASIASLRTASFDVDGLRLALPTPEVHLVVRIGALAEHGLDVHALGVREVAHRKRIPAGQRSVSARLRLGAVGPVLGVRAGEVAGRIVSLEELWGAATARRLRDRLASTSDLAAAAYLLDEAIGARLTGAPRIDPQIRIGLRATERLLDTPIYKVAADLGVSERHLRRVVRDTVGLSPKGFTKLARFHRALGAARRGQRASWASIASEAGYYDQAHLIAEFRSITGVTPQTLLRELAGESTIVTSTHSECA